MGRVEHGSDEQEAEHTLRERGPEQRLDGSPEGIDLELGATGQRDEREGERVDGLEALDGVVIDEMKNVRPGDDAGGKVAREVRQTHDLDELAQQRAGKEQEPEGREQRGVAAVRRSKVRRRPEDGEHDEQTKSVEPPPDQRLATGARHRAYGG